MSTAVAYSIEADEAAQWAERRVAEVMGVINAATAELVSVIATVIDTGAWGGGGLRTPAHWVAWKAGVSPARARSLVAMARRRGELPTVGAAFAQGGLSEDSVRLAVAHTPAARDAEVAELARVMTVPQLARTLRSLPLIDPDPPQGPEPRPDTDNGGEVGFGTDDDGRWSLRATGLPAERGALVRRALEAARDAEFRTRHPEADDDARAQGVTWSDALERMALAALEGLDPATVAGRSPSPRYQVLVHVDGNDPAAANLHLGPALSAAARRRITCDTSLRWVLEDEGRPVAAGRSRRTVEPVLRKLIEDRDRGCRVPWCTQTRGLEIHHIVHVEDGGHTVDTNLICVCPRDHDLHHRGLLGISGDPTRPDGLVFTDHMGRPIRAHRPLPPGRPPPEAARRLGVQPGRFEAPSGERFDGRWFAWN